MISPSEASVHLYKNVILKLLTFTLLSVNYPNKVVLDALLFTLFSATDNRYVCKFLELGSPLEFA